MSKRKIKPVELIEPENGWKEKTYYLAMVSLRPGNPEHEVIFFSGFLNGRDPYDKRYRKFMSGNKPFPGGYNVIWNPSYEGSQYEITQVETFRIVKELHTEQPQ